MRYWYKPISVFLSINLIIAQVSGGKSQEASKLVHVGYVGESVENISENYQNLVHQKMLSLVNQNFYEFYSPGDLSKSHRKHLDKILLNKEDSLSNDLSILAKAANLDYIFVTVLNNISEDPKRVMLKGEFLRYQANTNELYRYEMLSYAEDINLHIQAIKKEMIDTIPHSVHTIGRNRTYILAGIAIILALALSQSFTDLGKYLAGGDGSEKDTTPPIGN
ncbi:MAG: hypothetical protein CMF81_04710 [Candidatus Marinimicrobia bacterium]|nr:hypothetical protein [Candidatus Neomarinimicrobiota bacterium]